MNKQLIITAAIFGLTAVVLGAFGAHALKTSFTANGLENWKTAVSYQFYHTFALLFLSTFSNYRSRLIKLAYIAFSVGIILFSGSLYLLSLKNIIPLNSSFIGPVTPIGGLFLIIGWLCVLLAALKIK